MLNAVKFRFLSATIAWVAIGAACSEPGQSLTSPPVQDTTRTIPDDFVPPTGTATTVPVRKTAASYPMQYWISVPNGWPGRRTWPVVLAIAGSGRDYEEHTKLFSRVRDENNYPFIIVSPVVLTNNGDGPVPRTNPAFQYPSSTWDLVEREGRCTFDVAGITAIMAEVRTQFAGQIKPFLTGFSGGGHPTWLTVLLKPELLRGVAPVATNYVGRCVTSEMTPPAVVSSAPERVFLPINIFNGADDVVLQFTVPQQQVVINLARSNGFANISTVLIPGVGHDPMAARALAYFHGMLGPTER